MLAYKLFSVVAVSVALSALHITDSFVACLSEMYTLSLTAVCILNSIDADTVYLSSKSGIIQIHYLYSNLLLFKMVCILYKENYMNVSFGEYTSILCELNSFYPITK